MTKTNRHKNVLACAAGGQPRRRLLPLEMLSTCTCYSRLHWRCFGYVSSCYWTTWPSLVLARFRFLVDHVSGPIVPHVYFVLAHVSCCSSITCHFFIGPCVVFLLVHVAISYSTLCHGVVHPHFVFWFGHVAWWLPSTCQIFISPCVVPWLFHMSCTRSSTCHIFIWSRGLPRFYVLNNQFIIKVIRDHHCCTDWLHNYSTNVYIIIQHDNQTQQITVYTSAATHW